MKSERLICISLLDLSEYEDNPSTNTEPSLPIPPPPNDYENIEQTSNDPNIQDPSPPRVKFLTLDEFLPSGPGKFAP